MTEQSGSPTKDAGEQTPDALFVGADATIITGRPAMEAVRAFNDAAFVDPTRGIVTVPRERWAMAQQYERRTWMELAAHGQDDRNESHRTEFHGYAALHGKEFQHAIELGCGPFTNLRLLTEACSVRRCTLLDPLLKDYLAHRHCRYRNGFLVRGDTDLGVRLGGTFAGRVARRVLRGIRPQAVFRGTPVAELVSVAIEDMPARGPFDLVVMINVIEHCFDIKRIFERIARMTEPGAVLVFHDKLYDHEEVAANAGRRFDAGHPLRVDGRVIRGFLDQTFKPLFERLVQMQEVHEGIDLTETGLYFIGERV